MPRNFIPAVEKGVIEAIQGGRPGRLPGGRASRPLVYDGSYHPVDSSEICFKIAGAGASRKACWRASPILLEPIVNMKVTVPDDLTGDIISDLNTKRAHVSWA